MKHWKGCRHWVLIHRYQPIWRQLPCLDDLFIFHLTAASPCSIFLLTCSFCILRDQSLAFEFVTPASAKFLFLILVISKFLWLNCFMVKLHIKKIVEETWALQWGRSGLEFGSWIWLVQLPWISSLLSLTISCFLCQMGKLPPDRIVSTYLASNQCCFSPPLLLYVVLQNLGGQR